jgi:hypothetical protein
MKNMKKFVCVHGHHTGSHKKIEAALAAAK